MSEPTRLQLKERIEKQGMEMLERDIEIDALREANRSLTMQLWEIRHVVAAYRAFHVQEAELDSEATEE